MVGSVPERVSPGNFAFGVGALLYQEHSRRLVAVIDCAFERSLAVVISCIEGRSKVQEHFDGLQIACRCGSMEKRISSARRVYQRGSRREQAAQCLAVNRSDLAPGSIVPLWCHAAIMPSATSSNTPRTAKARQTARLLPIVVPRCLS
jgi:hypothetical protein